MSNMHIRVINDMNKQENGTHSEENSQTESDSKMTQCWNLQTRTVKQLLSWLKGKDSHIEWIDGELQERNKNL